MREAVTENGHPVKTLIGRTQEHGTPLIIEMSMSEPICADMGVEASVRVLFFFFQVEDGIRDVAVTGVQTCALPISTRKRPMRTQDPGRRLRARRRANARAARCVRWPPGPRRSTQPSTAGTPDPRAAGS